jgi:hypothetical protein
VSSNSLREFAVLASEFGSAEAHIALAELAETDTEEVFHVFAAKKLSGENVEAELNDIGDDELRFAVEAELQLVKSTPELYKLPENAGEEIIEATTHNKK